MKHTAGPWTWRYSSGYFYLETIGRGRLIVMDFVRMGMSSAQPRFAKWEGEDRGRLGGLMHKAKNLGELHDHPDARLIAAAPSLLEALKGLLSETSLQHSASCPANVGSQDYDPTKCNGCAVERARAAISEAEAPVKVG